ncbi:MAG: histidine kinase N-terminal 7TM domain-containing protein, partial [Halobacteria archaeon]|nr:histidine kinase N-terminal 7TM domain-containing protein [Halobacteria archaeon]
MGLMTAIGGWSLAYAIQVGFTSPNSQLIWQRIGLSLAGTVPLSWFFFTLYYTGKRERLPDYISPFLTAVPVVFAALTLTNSYHGLIWQVESFVSNPSFNVVSLSFGVGYFTYVVYAYVLVAGGLTLLFLAYTNASRRLCHVLFCPCPYPFSCVLSCPFQIEQYRDRINSPHVLQAFKTV